MKTDWLDAQPLSQVIPAEIRKATETAIEVRSSKILLKIAEGIVIGSFTEPCVRSYLSDEWEAYLAIISDEKRVEDVARAIRGIEHRISPLTCALCLSGDRGQDFQPAAHLRVVSDAIVDAVTGRGKKMICVSMPPRHGKSTLIARRTVNWFMCNWPDRFAGVMSYGDEFAQGWGRTIRNDVLDLPERFGFTVSGDSAAANNWLNSVGGGAWTGGVGGAITGRGCSLAVLDDVVKNRDAAASRVERDRTWGWWTSTARTRLTGVGAICVVDGTRWDSDDLIGRLTSGYDDSDATEWKVIRLAAVAEEGDALGRKSGEPLWPGGGFDSEKLEQTRRSSGEADWSALWQQVPIDERGIGAYRFNSSIHVREANLDPFIEVRLGVDFNVSPMSVVVGQVRNVIENDPGRRLHDMLSNIQPQPILEVIAELSLDDCTTAEAAAELVELLRRLGHGQKLRLRVTGDASGNQRHTSSGSSVPKTDWSIFRDALATHGDLLSVIYDVRSSNPGVRDRVNKVNGFLKPADGTVRFAVDPRCRVLINDLSKVSWGRDAQGNVRDTLSKKDPRLTHSSDALGYLCWIVGDESSYGERSGLMR
jgi:hypothetical protein